jgi:hypothetical protein
MILDVLRTFDRIPLEFHGHSLPSSIQIGITSLGVDR